MDQEMFEKRRGRFDAELKEMLKEIEVLKHHLGATETIIKKIQKNDVSLKLAITTFTKNTVVLRPSTVIPLGHKIHPWFQATGKVASNQIYVLNSINNLSDAEMEMVKEVLQGIIFDLYPEYKQDGTAAVEVLAKNIETENQKAMEEALGEAAGYGDAAKNADDSAAQKSNGIKVAFKICINVVIGHRQQQKKQESTACFDFTHWIKKCFNH